jgi:hypothetical protein
MHVLRSLWAGIAAFLDTLLGPEEPPYLSDSATFVVRGLGGEFRVEGKDMSVALKAGRGARIKLKSIRDRFGNIADIESPVFHSSDENVIILEDEKHEGQHSVVARSTGQLGEAVVTLRADAEVGEGVHELIGTVTLVVVAGTATVMELEVSEFLPEAPAADAPADAPAPEVPAEEQVQPGIDAASVGILSPAAVGPNVEPAPLPILVPPTPEGGRPFEAGETRPDDAPAGSDLAPAQPSIPLGVPAETLPAAPVEPQPSEASSVDSAADAQADAEAQLEADTQLQIEAEASEGDSDGSLDDDPLLADDDADQRR